MSREHENASIEAKSGIFGGWAKAHLGGLDGGLRDLQSSLAALSLISTGEDFPVYADMEAELLSLTGRIDEALATLDVVISRAIAEGHVFWLPALYIRRASLRRAVESHGAESDLREAIALARSQDSLRFQRQATRLLATLREQARAG
jgi:predicted ATPase